jgi:two-component system NarL family sensor kinase
MGLDERSREQLQHQLDALLRQQRELVQKLERGQGHFQQLARSVWRVQEEERRRLARELHDGIGQNLTAIVRMLDQVTLAAADSQPAQQTVALDKARALAESTLADTRALSRQLRPQILDDLGLLAALRWLSRTFRDDQGLDVALELTEPLPPLSADAQTLIFRVAQEALTNVVRHAGVARAQLVLHVTPASVRLRVHDDGNGCDTTQALAAGSEGRSSGLGGMRDRVQLFGGQLRVDSHPGAGCTIEIEFAFSPNAGTLGTNPQT